MIFAVAWGRMTQADGSVREGPMPRMGPFKLDTYAQARLDEYHAEDKRRARMFKRFMRQNAKPV